MKSHKFIAVLLMLVLAGISVPSAAQESVEPFLGMWALSLDYEDNSAGWLEVRQEKGYLDADLLWRWGSVEPVDYTMINGENLLLVKGQDVVKKIEGKPDRTLHPVYWYELSKEGADELEGRAYFPNKNGIGGEFVSFTGKRIPPESAAPKLKKSIFGNPVTLFNGKNMDGWELVEEGAVSGWKAVDGVMVNNPEQKSGEAHIHYGNLRSTATFEDFNLKLEVNVPAGSNSGVYLRGIYEVQVMDSYGKDLDPHNMGALYSRITPSEAAEKPAGEWQTMDITLYKRHLTVVLNGKTIINNQAVKGVTGGALTSEQFLPGPILLQGDHGKVSYRNIVLTPIVK
jgi:3-keto-disaccharide hydrolase